MYDFDFDTIHTMLRVFTAAITLGLIVTALFELISAEEGSRGAGAVLIVSLLMFATVATGCGPSPGLVVECHSLECPDEARVQKASDIFSQLVPAFDTDFDTPGGELTVEWWPKETVFSTIEDEFGTELSTVGQTESPTRVRVTSFAVYAHELFHVYYWRDFGNPDASHETGDGPWTDATNDRLVAIVQRLYMNGFDRPPPDPSIKPDFVPVAHEH